MNAPPAIAISGLNKRYGKFNACRDISFELGQGQVLGLLGPNGAGKTTIIKSIVGLVHPDSGSIRVFGQDALENRAEALRHVGAVVEAPVFYGFLSARDNLESLARLSGPVSRERLDEVLAVVGLADNADQKVDTFSYGMKQRLGIAQSLLPDNRLLILDEPTNGLDPHGILGIRLLIRKLSQEHGITILVSSHLLSEIEEIAEQVLIIHQGRCILHGITRELLAHGSLIFVRCRGLEALPSLPLPPLRAERNEAGEWELEFADDAIALSAQLPQLLAAGATLLELSPRRQTLEELFIALTKDTQDAASDRFGV